MVNRKKPPFVDMTVEEAGVVEVKQIGDGLDARTPHGSAALDSDFKVEAIFARHFGGFFVVPLPGRSTTTALRGATVAVGEDSCPACTVPRLNEVLGESAFEPPL